MLTTTESITSFDNLLSSEIEKCVMPIKTNILHLHVTGLQREAEADGRSSRQ
jgi:hypothetical protein